MKKKTRRWVCLDEQAKIIAFSITQGRFDRRRMNFTALDFGHWIKGGQKYAELESHFRDVAYGQHISTVEHGPIRCSRAKVSFLGVTNE